MGRLARAAAEGLEQSECTIEISVHDRRQGAEVEE